MTSFYVNVNQMVVEMMVMVMEMMVLHSNSNILIERHLCPYTLHILIE